MTKETYIKAINQVIYLSGCAVNGVVPDLNKFQDIDLENIYKAAQKHSLTAIVGYALESAGIFDKRFVQAKAKSIRKITVMEIDKEKLFQRMEQEKIRYAPLKGIIIKELYPSIGLRQMSDFDILFDSKYSQKVRDIMLELGFSCESFGKHNHDVYFKQPVSNFEMHGRLFNDTHKKEFREYYRDVEKRLIKDDLNSFGYHFGNNDLYIYLTAHEYKHYHGSGTGLRSLLDTYVIWKKLGDELDEPYIISETKKLGIDTFEQKTRQLALNLFGNGQLTDEYRKMFDYIIFSGTYGTLKNNIENSVKNNGGGKKGKLKFVTQKLFLPMDNIKSYYPFYYKHKILLPVLFFYRLGKAATIKRKDTINKLKILRKTNNTK